MIIVVLLLVACVVGLLIGLVGFARSDPDDEKRYIGWPLAIVLVLVLVFFWFVGFTFFSMIIAFGMVLGWMGLSSLWQSIKYRQESQFRTLDLSHSSSRHDQVEVDPKKPLGL